MNNFSSFAMKRLHQSWLLLKYTYGLVYVVAGIDKMPYFYLVTQWGKYISPFLPQFLNTIGLTDIWFLIVVGIIEIIIGLVILFYNTRLGAYILASWLLLICLNLATFGFRYLDLVVRDLVMAIGAVALAWLTEAQEKIS